LDELEISPMTVLGNLPEDARFPAAERRFESAGLIEVLTAGMNATSWASA